MIDQYASLSEKFLKKGFWLYLFSFIIAPMGYIIKIIISGELTVSEVGILYGIISLITMLSVYNDLGMTESLKYFIPQFVSKKRYDKVKSILFYALFSQIITSLVIASFFFFGAEYIAIHYFKTLAATETLQVFAFFFIGINIFQTINSFFIAVQDTLYQKFSDLVRMLFIMISVLFIFFGNTSSLLNYSYSWLIGLYIGTLTALYIFYKKYYKKYLYGEGVIIEKKLILQIVKYALFVFIGASGATVLGQIDMQMIIYLLGTTQAGYYTNYLSIIGIPFMILGPIFGLLFPIFSEMHSKKQHDKIKIVKQIFQSNFIAIGIMFNLFLFIFAEIIAYTLFGSKFIESGIILKYSILFLIFNFLLQMNFNIMAGVGKIHDRVKIIFIVIIFNVILNLIFIRSIGVYGAALATGFGWVLIWILSEYYLGVKYKVKFDFIFLAKNIIYMGGLGGIMYYFGLPLFEGLSRLYSFLFLIVIFSIWLSFFILINYQKYTLFIGEIRKLKK